MTTIPMCHKHYQPAAIIGNDERVICRQCPEYDKVNGQLNKQAMEEYEANAPFRIGYEWSA